MIEFKNWKVDLVSWLKAVAVAVGFVVFLVALGLVLPYGVAMLLDFGKFWFWLLIVVWASGFCLFLWKAWELIWNGWKAFWDTLDWLF